MLRTKKITYITFIGLLTLMVLLTACGGGAEPVSGPASSDASPAGQSAASDDGQSTEAAKEAPTDAPTDAPKEAETVTFTDTAGKTHELALPIEDVVVINRNIAEALQLLGAQDAVIATGDTTVANNPYLNYGELPDVGKTGEVNLELLLSLKPKVVFAYTNRPDQTLEEKLEPAGIAVVRMNHYLPDQIEEELRLLGRLFGKEERAEQFLTWKSGIEQLANERVKDIPEEEKKSVLALSVGFLNSDGGYRVFPSQSLDGSPGVGEGYATILAGGKDAADLQWDPSEASTTILVDEEYVLSRNPDVLTLHGTWLGGYDTTDTVEHAETLANIMNISSVPQLDAGKNDELYIFHTNIIGSDKRYIGVLQLAKYLYPERFAYLEPESYLKAYFEEWLGVPYQGVWHYSAKTE
ncbi:ABC transporter substrate-binding protein [Paenibacillus sp. TRM 82003]|nr:ABC transporter substrate-binding protein [Paenibacillus sp. TRM 82003]